MFKRLEKVVKADSNIAKEQRPQRNLVLTTESEEEFSVVLKHDSGIGTLKGVRFLLEGSRIRVVESTKTEELFTCRAYLLDGGDCTFVVDDQMAPLFPWQISRKALEGVFF